MEANLDWSDILAQDRWKEIKLQNFLVVLNLKVSEVIYVYILSIVHCGLWKIVFFGSKCCDNKTKRQISVSAN